MDRLETRQLAYFVAVAEELHFGRAAERLGIAAPPLSRAISQLERRIGVRLLERTSRRVCLTAPGEVLLAESRTVLAALDATVRRVQRADRAARLVVAVRSGSGTGLLLDLVQALDRPGAEEIDILFTDDQAAALRDGTADVGLLCAGDDLAGLSTADLLREEPVALLPADHRLSGRSTVTLAELRADPVFSPSGPQLSLNAIVDLVALGRLVVVVGHSSADRLGRAVVAVPVTGLPGTMLVLAWHHRHRSPALVSFIRTATRLAADRPAADRPAATVPNRPDNAPVGEGRSRRVG